MGFDPVSYLMGKEAGGGGGGATVEPLSVSENGTYTAPSGKAYSPVTVAVPTPNSVETITGTVANPWGDKTPSDLFSKAKSNQITVSMVVDGSALSLPTFSVVFYPYSTANYFEIVGASGNSVSDWFAGTIGYAASGEVSSIYILQNSTVVSLIDYASLLTTTLTIIHHPLQEGGDGA